MEGRGEWFPIALGAILSAAGVVWAPVWTIYVRDQWPGAKLSDPWYAGLALGFALQGMLLATGGMWWLDRQQALGRTIGLLGYFSCFFNMTWLALLLVPVAAAALARS